MPRLTPTAKRSCRKKSTSSTPRCKRSCKRQKTDARPWSARRRQRSRCSRQKQRLRRPRRRNARHLAGLIGGSVGKGGREDLPLEKQIRNLWRIDCLHRAKRGK